MDTKQLRQIMQKGFSEPELFELCFELDIPTGELPRNSLTQAIIEVIKHCERHNKLDALETYCRTNRPHLFDAEEMEQQKEEWQKALKKYYASLREQVGYVRILGRNQAEPLENIFTHVNLLDKPTAEQRYNIHKLIEEFNPRDFKRLERTERLSGNEAVAQFSKLFILGKPGAGKTTFMKHTALRSINREIKKVPVFITLKELSDSERDIDEFISDLFVVHGFENPQKFLGWILRNGVAIVLFDGLDEVNLENDKRANLIHDMNLFIKKYSRCAFFITCRVAATDYSFEQFQYVEMADFNEEQIGVYIDQWFKDDEEKRRNCREAVLEDDNYQAVRELAQVPLLLSLLCLVYEERNEFPPERHEIYEEATRALLSKWDASRNIRRDVVYQQLSLKRKESMLAHLAFETFKKGDYFLAEQKVSKQIEQFLEGVPNLDEPDGNLVLKTMEAQHGIFVERARRIHSFSHLTLQEYFTAKYIVDNEARGAVKRLMQFVGDDRWTEVFLLTAGMLDDATDFCQQYLEVTAKLIAKDSQLKAQLNWAIQKGACIGLPFKATTVQAFLIHCALEVVGALAENFAMASADDFAIASGSNSASASAIVSAISRANASALKLASANDLDIASDLAHHLMNARSSTRHIDFASDPTSYIARWMFSLVASDVARASTLAQDMDLTTLADGLSQLTVPETTAKQPEWQAFSEQLEAILDIHQEEWDIYRKFPIENAEMEQWKKLSKEHVELLAQYLEANHLLVRCMQVAYVPNRQAIEDQILIPPA